MISFSMDWVTAAADSVAAGPTPPDGDDGAAGVAGAEGADGADGAEGAEGADGGEGADIDAGAGVARTSTSGTDAADRFTGTRRDGAGRGRFECWPWGYACGPPPSTAPTASAPLPERAGTDSGALADVGMFITEGAVATTAAGRSEGGSSRWRNTGAPGSPGQTGHDDGGTTPD
ncbi:MAG: hypothetical protein VX000_17070, partial [Myxococcota bacterium]|nr:hypothetical protein [Myxococcota bacterium]